ncbi:tyrosine-type recombinase/integrase [Haloferula sp. A504]|uniref:tyrosine-type recombinase/integrase n=1 Tax=Haloferula sp. A504 TaxID=3373601 RepID=UPI0031C61CD2|nr:hypothetical protein [Verrucomicrobiaceae bacterium E54]
MATHDKTKHFKIEDYKNPSGTISHRVSGRKASGERVRRNFANYAEALQAMADYEAGYEDADGKLVPRRTRLSEAQLADAEAAITAANGRNLSRIVSRHDALQARANKHSVDLDTVIRFFESHYREEIREITVFNAYRKFLKAKEVTSPKTQEHYKSSLKKLLKPEPNRLLHSFTVTDMEDILETYKSLNSKRTMRRSLSAFFNWAVRHHYTLENPCERLDKIPRDMSEIGVLTLEECKRLLCAAMHLHEGAAAATVALGLFAGLRPSEIRDLKPCDIGKGKIRVSGGKLRRALKRSVPIPPVLKVWLEKFPFKGLPPGWDGKLKILKKATGAQNWTQDVIRHTSISFQAERDQDEAFTALKNGTSKEMMDAHYRQVVDDEDVVSAFWDLLPDRVEGTELKSALPTPQRFDYPSKAKLKHLVWKKPLTHIAADLGVSDVALKKHCTKLGIELPGRGFWQKAAAKKK